MPRGDGTGPMGGGTGAGRGMGGGGGRGMGGGRMGGLGLGASGSCVCPKCGKSVPHQTGMPCTQVACPACGTQMTRAVVS
ncbi:MAG: hypothetical protein WC340_02520 [Kiritimatiellia bacterium]